MIGRHFVVPVYLLLCLALGGASAGGYAANLMLQLAALPLIGWSLWTIAQKPPVGPARSALILAVLLVAIMLSQLIPLPPSVWTALPGRQSIEDGFHLLGIPLPWLPLSLAPSKTVASLLWLLPAFAVVLSVVALGAFRARWIVLAILVTTALSILIGALQLVGGGDSLWYFYEITNPGVAVGWFANANHEASLLLVAIPFLAALQTQLRARARAPQHVSAVWAITGAGFVVIAIGLLTNMSLAGLGLCVPVALTSYWLLIRLRKPRWWMLAIGGLLCAAAVSTIIIGPFHNNLIGKQEENVDLSRQTSFALTWQAARGFLPVGSGVGTFQSVYNTQEPIARTTDTYMNHAHGDWLEIVLETGLIGLGLAAMFLWWWFRQALAIFRLEEADVYARAAVVASAALMLHSLVDYPLRTAALSAVFAACVGLMARARPFIRPARRAKGVSRHFVAE